MNNIDPQKLAASYTAFDGFRLIASGDLDSVANIVKTYYDSHPDASLLVFDDKSSEVVDIDFRGSVEEFHRRRALSVIQDRPTQNLIAELKNEHAAPGRPKLGVVAREVTLLPRHWEWLNRQPGGASVALRKLVEEARRVNGTKDRIREAQEATYRFMSAIAGDLPGFEEALRALFAGDALKLQNVTKDWPKDVRLHALKLSAESF